MYNICVLVESILPCSQSLLLFKCFSSNSDIAAVGHKCDIILFNLNDFICSAP